MEFQAAEYIAAAAAAHERERGKKASKNKMDLLQKLLPTSAANQRTSNLKQRYINDSRTSHKHHRTHKKSDEKHENKRPTTTTTTHNHGRINSYNGEEHTKWAWRRTNDRKWTTRNEREKKH